MDLLFSAPKKFRLYENQEGIFSSSVVGDHDGEVTQLSVSDFDSDGDLDVFAASKQGNTLLVNENGMLNTADLESFGLPEKSITANWVDFDNDGRTDLHVLPGGLYKQRPDGSFGESGILRGRFIGDEAYSTWFDVDNDGRIDLLVAIEKPIPGWTVIWRELFSDTFYAQEWNLYVYRNVMASNHWLEVELTGTEGNSPAIGALVEVVTASGTQRQQVGQAEGSLRSQGHYRLYFGLGQDKKVEVLRIRWPDGHVQEMTDVAADQLLTLIIQP
jgi:hypothetical protein